MNLRRLIMLIAYFSFVTPEEEVSVGCVGVGV